MSDGKYYFPSGCIPETSAMCEWSGIHLSSEFLTAQGVHRVDRCKSAVADDFRNERDVRVEWYIFKQ